MAKGGCDSTHYSRDGKRVVKCVHPSPDHAAQHEGVDMGAPNGPDVLRWDRNGNLLN